MTVRLLHLSDIHFGAENREAVAATVDFARRERFDLMIVSGDITQSGSLPEFALAAEWLAAFPGSRLCTPGNHDTPWMGLVDRVVRPFNDYGISIGPHAAESFSMAGVSVRNVNTARGWQLRLNWSKGEISRPQTRRVIEAFDSDPLDDIRLLVCHHPLVEAVGEPMTARVRGGPAAAMRLTKAGVDVVLSGHTHAPFCQSYPFGDRLTHAVGAGTLSRRERGVPASFNVVEIDANELNVQVMAWTDGRFAAAQQWVAPLRPRAPPAMGRQADGLS